MAGPSVTHPDGVRNAFGECAPSREAAPCFLLTSDNPAPGRRALGGGEPSAPVFPTPRDISPSGIDSQ